MKTDIFTLDINTIMEEVNFKQNGQKVPFQWSKCL